MATAMQLQRYLAVTTMLVEACCCTGKEISVEFCPFSFSGLKIGKLPTPSVGEEEGASEGHFSARTAHKIVTLAYGQARAGTAMRHG